MQTAKQRSWILVSFPKAKVNGVKDFFEYLMLLQFVFF